MGSQLFPIKAPTRQMLYPLSYRGINSMAARMLTPVVDLVNHRTRRVIRTPLAFELRHAHSATKDDGQVQRPTKRDRP